VKKSENMSFKPSVKVVRIGRSPNCEVIVNDNMLSRFHCFIEFKSEVGWVVQDGVVYKNENELPDYKPSTNGTWLYIIEDVMIKEGMIFKANHTLFQCHLTNFEKN
jgi:pSer/pThr/pTyr-binding forkhead associated (FHA) protein